MATVVDKTAHGGRPLSSESEERAEKAARIRAALRPFQHLEISTEEYLREKHAELAREKPQEGD